MKMVDAVIVSTARTGVGKAYRGALNNTEGPTMAEHVIAEAVKRAGIAPGEVEDVVMGCAMQQGTMVMNVARKGAIRAGLQAIAVAARSVMLDGVEIAIGGGIESISLVQNEHMNKFHAVDRQLPSGRKDQRFVERSLVHRAVPEGDHDDASGLLIGEREGDAVCYRPARTDDGILRNEAAAIAHYQCRAGPPTVDARLSMANLAEN
jgi:acetyl-CoA acetyltransferase